MMASKTPTPPRVLARGSHDEGGWKEKLLKLFEGMGDEERRKAMEEAIEILKDILHPAPPPVVTVEDPQNGVPQGSVAPFLVPCVGKRGFTLPFHDDYMPRRRYYRQWAVLPSGTANVPCSGVEPKTLLRWLNTIFETRITLSDGVKSCLLAFIDDGCDLGMVYGYLRPWMRRTPDDDGFSKSRYELLGDSNLIVTPVIDDSEFSKIPNKITDCRRKDSELRSAAIDSDRIVNSKVPPRRVWDLHATRVLPFYAISSLPEGTHSKIPRNLWAVSHSWLPASDRQSVLTTINGKAWRVPIPRDTTLEMIRNELLMLGAEYVFLDVLCLRQKDELLPELESIRKREWRLDVPTIGHVYSYYNQTVIVYFNGLGLPFRDGGANRGDKFHWFNRAWTLQECPFKLIPGGLQRNARAFKFYTVDRSWASKDFCDHFASVSVNRYQSNLGDYIKEIQSRYCSNPVDQVACLAYLLQCETLPIYDADLDVEVAWSLLVECLPDHRRLELLLSDFGPRSPWSSWRPTWRQVIGCHTFRSIAPLYFDSYFDSIPNDLRLRHLDGSSPNAGFRYGSDAYYTKSYVIEDCLVSAPQPEDRRADARVSVPCACTLEATPHHHQFRISGSNGLVGASDGNYILVLFGFRHMPSSGPYDRWPRGNWLLVHPEGIRRVNNEKAIMVSKVSTVEIPPTHQHVPLKKGIIGCEKLVVYR